MSPHAANSLITDLVEMAKAMETLPQVEHQLKDAQATIDALQTTIQRLELKLMDRAGEIDKLNASIRELEVAKDQAETMFLEADDRTARALEFVKTMFGSAGSLIQALEPAKPQEPVKFDDGGSYNEPIAHNGHPGNVDSVVAVPEGQYGDEGQSAADPLHDFDPEPAARWSNEWYDWKDRQRANGSY